jgi:tetratricopeptide (TPR) repeat protein
VPETIQDVIMARIDRLEGSPKKALQLASVIGREFTVRLLDRISELQAQLDRFLQELKVLRFIHERSSYPELAYMFKHALAHDVAYNSLLVHRRKALHQLVAMTIEELYADRLAGHYEMLASHYERGELWEKTLEYLVKAAQKAQQAYANQESMAHYDRALEVCERLPTAVEPLTLLTLYAGKATVHFLMGEMLPSIRAYERLLEVVRQLGDRGREAGDKFVEGYNLFGLGLLHNWQGDYDRALQFEGEGIRIGQVHNIAYILCWTIRARGLPSCGKGEYEEALALLQEALKLSTQLSDKVARPRILNSLGWVYAELYNLDAALRHNHEAAEAAYTIGEPELIRYAELNLAADYLILGDLEQAHRYSEKVHHAVQQAGKWGDEWMKWRYSQNLFHNLGELWLTKGDAEQALYFPEECLKPAGPTITRKNVVKGWRLKGQAFCAQRRLPEAGEALHTALAIATEIANPLQLWKTYQALGELCERKSER